MADIRSRFSTALRRLPADLATVAALDVLASGAVLLPAIRETPVRLALGLPFLLFLPGYALVAAAFPRRDQPIDLGGATAGSRATDRVSGGTVAAAVRLALSFGASIALVILAGLALDATPWGVGRVQYVLAVGGFTLGCTALAAYRRRAVPAEERFAVPFRRYYAMVRDELLRPDSGVDLALNVALAATVLLAAASIGYAASLPADEEGFSELYLLTETGNGTLVADDYPTDPAEGGSVVVGITNRERERVAYSVVALFQQVRLDGTNDGRPVTIEQRQFEATLGHNESWRTDVRIPSADDDRSLRAVFLLYRGDPPADLSMDNAYREVHLWLRR